MAARGFRDSSLREFALANSWQSKQNKCASAQPNLARFVVQKIGIKGRSSASADFLLEADKRGTLPKSEKRSFWRVGRAGRGVQPFCEKESKLSGENSVRVAESTLDSALAQNLKSGLPRRFCESARNDGLFDYTNRTRNDRFILTRSKF